MKSWHGRLSRCQEVLFQYHNVRLINMFVCKQLQSGRPCEDVFQKLFRGNRGLTYISSYPSSSSKRLSERTDLNPALHAGKFLRLYLGICCAKLTEKKRKAHLKMMAEKQPSFCRWELFAALGYPPHTKHSQRCSFPFLLSFPISHTATVFFFTLDYLRQRMHTHTKLNRSET